MDPGEQTTGTRDEHYDLISTLYHALKGAEACDAYALDAEAGRHVELAEFFRETQVAYAGITERAKELLGIPKVPPRVGGPPGAAPEEPARPEDVVVAGEAPAEDVPPEDLEATARWCPRTSTPPSRHCTVAWRTSRWSGRSRRSTTSR